MKSQMLIAATALAMGQAQQYPFPAVDDGGWAKPIKSRKRGSGYTKGGYGNKAKNKKLKKKADALAKKKAIEAKYKKQYLEQQQKFLDEAPIRRG